MVLQFIHYAFRHIGDTLFFAILISDEEIFTKTVDDWFNKNPHLIQNLFDLNKNNPDLPIMELSPNSPLREHDVIVFEFVKGEGPNHVAIYLGNGTIIHHPRNKYACIETLNKTLEKTMYKIYRHEKFN